VIGLYRDDRGAKPPRLAHERAGLDAKAFGRVARGNGAGGIRERLHDDDGLAAQGGIFLLFARCKKGVEIEEQPLDGIWPEVTKRSDLTHKRTNHELRPPYERHRARP